MMTPSTRSWPSIPISTFFPFRPSSGLVRPSLATRSRPSPLAYLVRSLRNAVYIGTLVYAKSRYSEVGKKRWEGPLASAVLLSSLIECAHCGKRGHVHRQVRGRIQSHYVCGGYVASGRGVCEGF